MFSLYENNAMPRLTCGQVDEEDVAQQQQAYVAAGADDGETAEDQFKNKKRKMLEMVCLNFTFII